MKKPINIVIGVFLLVLLSCVVFFNIKSDEQVSQKDDLSPAERQALHQERVQKGELKENWQMYESNAGEDGGDALSLFDREDMLDFNTMMEYARTGKIDLVSELWALRRQCPKNLLREHCNQKILRFLVDKFPFPDNQKLVDLYTNYLKYEETMRDYRFPSDITLEQKREILRKIRNGIFGEENARLIFGYNDAKADLLEAQKDFLQRTEGMTGDEKLAAYEQLRRDTLGEYYDAFYETEQSFDRYQVELNLRQNDYQNLDGAAKQDEIHKMREKYFGKDGAERMAKVDQEWQAHKQLLSSYEEKEKQLIRENPELTEEELEEKILKLQEEMLGSEEAEMYRRRKMMEDYWDKNK